MLEYRIHQARIIDGSGNPWFRGDVGIEGGRIVALGDLSELHARYDLDAADRYLAPGFIDVHSHSDFSLPRFPRGESKVSQGVTTEVGGNCGMSPFPVEPTRLDLLREYTSIVSSGLEWEWKSAQDYMQYLEGRPLSHNFAALVGHGSVRVSVMGFDQRAPEPVELEAMKKSVSAAMEAGAFGLSSGLIYAPGSYATSAELIELCQVVRRYGGIYTSHIRNESTNLLKSVEEALTIGRQARLPVQLSHHKAMGESNWGLVKESLALVDRARQAGEDVTLDQYPYTGSATTITAFLPDWALEGGMAALLGRLRDPATRRTIAQQVPWGRGTVRWSQVVISSLPKTELKSYEGLSVEQIAQAKGTDPVETVLDLLLTVQGAYSVIHFSMSEEDVEFVMRHRAIMIGSDGSSMSPARGGRPHPRAYGTFARVLGTYAREKGIISLEEAVRKMTSLPAQRFGLWNRGLVRPGFVADLVLFDYSQIKDRSTFANPHQYAEGVEWVMVGGQIVWQSGQDTGAVAGRVLRSRPDQTQ